VRLLGVCLLSTEYLRTQNGDLSKWFIILDTAISMRGYVNLKTINLIVSSGFFVLLERRGVQCDIKKCEEESEGKRRGMPVSMSSQACAHRQEV